MRKEVLCFICMVRRPVCSVDCTTDRHAIDNERVGRRGSRVSLVFRRTHSISWPLPPRWNYNTWISNKNSYQVWALGKECGVPQGSIVNFCGPLLPYNSANPFIGTREVPVTNCKSLARVSRSNEVRACKYTTFGKTKLTLTSDCDVKSSQAHVF